jgi:hypothetical protein
VGFFQELLEVAHVAVILVYPVIVGYIVAVVAQRGRVERQQPKGGHAQALQVGEFAGEAGEIPYAVAVAVAEGFYVQLVDHRVLVPVRVPYRVKFCFHVVLRAGPARRTCYFPRGRPATLIY